MPGLSKTFRGLISRARQQARFNRLRGPFREAYGRLKDYDLAPYLTPLWDGFTKEAERALLPRPPFHFLGHPVIRHTMHVTATKEWAEAELAYLEGRIPEGRLARLLAEEAVGAPAVRNLKYLTSHNSIHHLYHLVRFSGQTRCDLENLSAVVEWGGGYGNLSRIFRRLRQTPATYVIVDLPLFSCLQWLYLSTVFGPGEVNLLSRPGAPLESGKINLLPLCFLDRHQLSADLFISTWAISESSVAAQDLVRARRWFGSRHLLIGYNRSDHLIPFSDRVGQLAAGDGASIEKIDFIPGPGSYYALR